jgi:hypothetical protein
MTIRYRTRYAHDEAEGVAELRDMLSDPDVNLGDLVAAAIEHCPEDQCEEMYEAVRELGEDRRGPRQWAADRLERRRVSRDMRSRDRRLGRDRETWEQQVGIEPDKDRATGDRRRLAATTLRHSPAARAPVVGWIRRGAPARSRTSTAPTPSLAE